MALLDIWNALALGAHVALFRRGRQSKRTFGQRNVASSCSTQRSCLQRALPHAADVRGETTTFPQEFPQYSAHIGHEGCDPGSHASER